jgi:arabinofuranosyltransferase
MSPSGSAPVDDVRLSRGSLVALVALVAVSTIHLASICGWPGQGVDDSLITQVYGRNLASGHGWVFQPGGERVEGSTSPLYTLLWAAAFLTPVPRALMQGVGLLCCLFALRRGQRASRRLARAHGADGAGASWWFVLLAATVPPLVTWSTVTLMDSSIWLALVMAATSMLAREEPPGGTPRDRAATAIVAALLPLARPDGLAVAPAWLALLSLRPRPPRVDLRRVRGALVAFVLTAAGLTAFRLWYFGYPLPNTFYAKVSPSIAYDVREGLSYVLHSLARSPTAALALAVSLVVLGRWRWRGDGSGPRREGFSEGRVAIFALLLVGVPVVVGGDHFAQGRFLVPAYATALVVAAAALSRVTPGAVTSTRRRRPRTWALALCAATVALAIAARSIGERNDSVRMEFVVARSGLEFGRALNRITAGMRPRPSWGVFTAGGTAFAYEGPVVDLLGLNDVAMAHAGGGRRGIKNHAAFDRAVFYRQAPDLVQYSTFVECVDRPRRAFRRRLVRSFTDGLPDEPEFRRRYVPMVVATSPAAGRDPAPEPCVEGMALYVKRRLAERLAEAGAVPVDGSGDAKAAGMPAPDGLFDRR